jgi:hypothetical protein
VKLVRHRQTKETATDRFHLRNTAPVLDPTLNAPGSTPKAQERRIIIASDSSVHHAESPAPAAGTFCLSSDQSRERSRDHLILRLVPIVPAVQSLTAVQEFKGSKVQGERDTAGSEGFASRNGPVKIHLRIALDLLIGYAPASERAGSRIGSALWTSRGRGKQATNLSSLRLP